MVIYLDRPSPDGSSGLPGSRRAALCFLFGLASSEVCMCPPCYQWGGSLLHCLSTLTCFHAVYFCCTVPEVAFAGRYPAPCPLKPGLSSPASLRTAAATICLTQNLFILAYIYFDVQTCVYIFFVTAFTDNVHMDAHSYENTTEKNGYNYTFRQLPPINSLRIEVFGITSLSIARK